jgi:hypothetical protein
MFERDKELFEILFFGYFVPWLLIAELPDFDDEVELFTNKIDGVVFLDLLI